MPFYQTRGKIPNKRHTVFKNPKGGIYYEELVSREGFSYIYSNLYHLNMPTKVKRLGDFEVDNTHTYLKEDHKSYHFTSLNPIHSAIPLLYNKDILIGRFSYDNYSDERTRKTILEEQEINERAMLAREHATLDDAVAYSFDDGASAQEIVDEHESS